MGFRKFSHSMTAWRFFFHSCCFKNIVFSGYWDAHTLDMLRFLLTDLMIDSQWGLGGA
jgi:hypothetical protein